MMDTTGLQYNTTEHLHCAITTQVLDESALCYIFSQSTM